MKILWQYHRVVFLNDQRGSLAPHAYKPLDKRYFERFAGPASELNEFEIEILPRISRVLSVIRVQNLRRVKSNPRQRPTIQVSLIPIFANDFGALTSNYCSTDLYCLVLLANWIIFYYMCSVVWATINLGWQHLLASIKARWPRFEFKRFPVQTCLINTHGGKLLKAKSNCHGKICTHPILIQMALPFIAIKVFEIKRMGRRYSKNMMPSNRGLFPPSPFMVTAIVWLNLISTAKNGDQT